MLIIWSLLWGAVSLAVIVSTIQWYLPKLRMRMEDNADKSPTEKTEVRKVYLENDKAPADSVPVNWYRYLPVLCVCICFACLCGYRVADTVDSVISIMKMLLGFCVLSAVLITDMELLIIPNRLVLILFGGRLISLIPEFLLESDVIISRLISSVIGALVCLLLFFVVSKLTNGGLGEGDTKLFCGIGFLCGLYAVVYTLLFACFICGFTSFILLITKRKTLKDVLPMGPFVLIGYIIMILLAVY